MRRPLHWWLAASILFLDQTTKAAVAAWLSPEAQVPVIPGFFRLVYVENPGMAFGLLSDSPSGLVLALLVTFSVATLALLGFLLWRDQSWSPLARTGLALILGGAAGNFVDRIARGAVIDFLDFSLGSYHWPAFNVADSALVVGAAFLLLDLLRAQRPSKGVRGKYV